MAYTSPSRHRTALLASSVAVMGLLTACGNGAGTASPPQKVPGTAAPATGDTTTGAGATRAAPSGGITAPGRTATHPGSSSAATAGDSASGTGAAARSTRCHTSELKAMVGRNDPGAGQENFPVVLTNTSGRTCTVHGYPGAAFVDASGRQLGPDPKREAGTPTTVTLRPGASAWAGLTFSNPGVSGARTATPAALIVTPPDERDHLTVTWTAGQVPVGGNASSVFLTVLGAGAGP
ncbi:DUF4232 domain-containing protein [Streptomyces carpinensis]|uniref:DUF4232 domain-containing protein n=1 Tax=Streptomyces carpinensis TaxID=66369 RepID=A0ABV1WF53_9ACTN|nr:DUF4232 domain-containing protein [Streptomyces carpinensis]